MGDSSVTPVSVVGEDWRRKSRTVVSRTSFLLNTPELSDIQFVFNKNEDNDEIIIYGHKFILAIASPVFHKMFFGNNQQFTTTVESRMDMNHHTFTAEAFLTFIKFLYADEINYDGLSMEVIVGILNCSDYYDVPYLKMDCAKQLKKIITRENVVQLLDTAILFRESDLAGKALEFIDINLKFVFESEEILCAKMETLVSILKRDSLDIHEYFVLNLALKWAEHECNRKHLEPTVENKRKVLGDVFFEIRFGLLTSDMISKSVASGLLTLKESVDVLLAVHKPQSSNFQRFCQKALFKSHPRVFRGKKLELIKMKIMDGNWKGTNELGLFKVQASLYLQGFPPDTTEEDVKHYIELASFGTDLKINKMSDNRGAFHVRFLYNPSLHKTADLLRQNYILPYAVGTIEIMNLSP